MLKVNKYAVVLEGNLPDVGALSDFADGVMEALIDQGAEDPFVFTDASVPSFRVEIVVQAANQTEALSDGVQAISSALGAAGVEIRTAVESPSARAEDLVPA